MRPHECLRFQGIRRRRLHGLSPNKIREMIGNYMHVGTVSAIVRSAFKLMKDSVLCDSESNICMLRQSIPVLDEPESASNSKNLPSKTGGAIRQLHFQNFRVRKGTCFEKGLVDQVILKKIKDAGYLLGEAVVVYGQASFSHGVDCCHSQQVCYGLH